jgi:hypothetical protein
MIARAAPRGVSWDFSKIPVFATDRANRPQGRSSLSPQLLPSIIQPKLAIGDVNDPLEHEADRVADQVMRMPNPDLSITGAPPQISRKCAACEEEAKTLSGQTVALPIVEQVLQNGGGSLPDELRAEMEHRFANDFSNVRVHTDSRAAESAAAVGARAYTVGREMLRSPPVSMRRTRPPAGGSSPTN